jgi:CheY-like chemotaxis protein
VRRSHGRAKPRVLLVDDHRGVLDTVSALLADDFDVAGVATGGRQALETARRVDPDLVVLDINMPGLDGFETFRELEQAGSRSPVVFLSMHHGDERVAEAFRCGGRGYVLKSRVAHDLAHALDHVLLGRRFLPSLTALHRLADDGGHAMQLHGGGEAFLDGLAALFDLALQSGDATCVIASEEVRAGLDGRLRSRGWNVDGLSRHQRYLVVDAADALDRFMRNGLPDPDRLAEIAAELDEYRLAVAEGAVRRLTIFGDMAASLSVQGNAEAVVALESRWNALTRGLPFFTVCGYTSSCFHEGVPGLWPNACDEHSAVSHARDA